MLVHATAVAVDGVGVLLLGPSGAGKSDLALRLIDQGAVLVADDQTDLARDGARLVARAPAALAGLLEVRGLGIVTVPHRDAIALVAAFDLVAPEAVERLPERASVVFLGIALPLFRIAAREPSAPAKLRLAARRAAGQ